MKKKKILNGYGQNMLPGCGQHKQFIFKEVQKICHGQKWL